MVAVAREQAEAIAQAAREQGFEAGYDEGIAHAEAAVVERLALAEQLVAQVARGARGGARLVRARPRRARLPDRREGRAPARRGRSRRDASACSSTRCARRSSRDGLTVLCNPDDLERCSRRRASSLQTHGRQPDGLEPDRRPRASRTGGVVVRTDAGDIDATIESQLERLRDLLFDERAAA